MEYFCRADFFRLPCRSVLLRSNSTLDRLCASVLTGVSLIVLLLQRRFVCLLTPVLYFSALSP